MKTFLLDTNILLRYFLQDIEKQVKSTEKLLEKAKDGEVACIIISEVFPEIDYVLRKVYQQQKEVIVEYLNNILKTPYITVEQQELWIEALQFYLKNNLDIVDCFLISKAKAKEYEVFTFDRKLNKLYDKFNK